MKTRYLSLLLAMLFGILQADCKKKALKKKDHPELSSITLPPGFHISVFADSVHDARSLALGDKGTVFVGNRSGDNVFALVDEDNDGVADKKYTLISGMNMPNGVSFYKGALYIAEVNKVWKLDNIESNLAHPPSPVPVYSNLPNKEHHGWKYIAFGPDGSCMCLWAHRATTAMMQNAIDALHLSAE